MYNDNKTIITCGERKRKNNTQSLSAKLTAVVVKLDAQK